MRKEEQRRMLFEDILAEAKKITEEHPNHIIVLTSEEDKSSVVFAKNIVGLCERKNVEF